MSDLLEFGSNAIEIWRTNPSFAAHSLLYNPLSNNPDEQFTLLPIQRIVINRVWESRNAIVVACRGWGKTFGAATIAILKAWLFPGRRVGCLSASFRQAKQIFEEINNIWQRSPLLQACTERQPIISNDACRLIFKTVAGNNPSVIVALPLADGNKIRGSRFHDIIVDETVHVPEIVFNMVIRPFAATSQNPAVAVRIEEEKDRIIASSFMTDEEKKMRLEELDGKIASNQIIQLTSGYYSFNYVYQLYCKYSNRMHGIVMRDEKLDESYSDNPIDYATFQIPWYSLPKGFLSKGGLEDARRDMSPLQFRMEYEAAWVSDSGGFFKASDIEMCRADNIPGMSCKLQATGDPSKAYLMAIDPARTFDAFAIVILEFDPQYCAKVIYAEQHFRQPVTLMAKRIFELTNLFNIIQIGMDKGGGGHQVGDILAEGSLEGFAPIYDIDDERYRGLRGRHILKLVDFGSNWIEDAHHKAYNLLNRRQIIFPNVPIQGGSSADLEDKIYSVIETMIVQIINVEPSETRTGKIHFDLPDTGGGYVKHKDLYSAFIIGCDMIYDLLQSYLLPNRRMPLLGVIYNTEYF